MDSVELPAKEEAGMSDNEASQHLSQEEIESEYENSMICIKVVSSTGHVMLFKIKRNVEMRKLQDAYAKRIGKGVDSVRFLYDGSRINENDTPISLDMEDNDTIDVMVARMFPLPCNILILNNQIK